MSIHQLACAIVLLLPSCSPTGSEAAAAEPLQRIQHAGWQRASDGRWVTRNTLHQLELAAGPSGLEVRPMPEGDSGDWHLTLRTAGFGRFGSVQAVDAPSVTAAEGRVSLQFSALEEWFVAKPEGLEQGWTIHAPPEGDGPLWIRLAFDGPLALRIDDHGRAGTLVDRKGEPRLRYRDLIAFDATGRELVARLESSPSGPGIRVEDTGAVYPLTVDPLIIGPVWSVSPENGADFGTSIAAGDFNGDRFTDLAAGGPTLASETGRVHVYHGAISGLSNTPATSLPSLGDQVIGESFGYSLAALDINGDGFSDLAVGAPKYDNGSFVDAGRVRLYLGSPGGLSSAPANWAPSLSAGNAQFAFAVANAGDVNGDGFADLLVGAPFHGGNDGLVELYLGSSLITQVSAPTPAPAWSLSGSGGERLGHQVSTAGDIDNDGYSDFLVSSWNIGNGRVRLFNGGIAVSALAWQTLEGSSEELGVAMACAGDVNGDGHSDVVLGAPGTSLEAGAAKIYLGSPSGLTLQATLPSTPLSSGSRFGSAVDTAGNFEDGYSGVVIGAAHYSAFRGQVAVYPGSSSGTQVVSDPWTDLGGAGGRLGTTVRFAGDTDGNGYPEFAASAPVLDRVQVWQSAPGGLTDPLQPEWSAQGGSRFGYSVWGADDLDGDGKGDLIVGEETYNNPNGRVCVYLSSDPTAPSGSGVVNLPALPTWQEQGSNALQRLGSVVCAGDVMSAYPGVEVIASTANAHVIIYEGSTGSEIQDLSPGGGSFGHSIRIGRINGDSIDDLIVTQPNSDQVFVFFGTASSLLSSTADMTLSAGTRFGYSVACADFNGDSFDDLIVGDDLEAGSGKAWVYLTPTAPLSTIPSPTPTALITPAGCKRFGFSMDSAGDVNADGFTDLIIGDPEFQNRPGDVNEGACFLFLGGPGGFTPGTPAPHFQADQNDAKLGYAVAGLGDVNADGYEDVAIGAPELDGSLGNEGRVLVFLGAATGLTPFPGWAIDSGEVGAELGLAVAALGSTNGDVTPELIVGAPGSGGGIGRVAVYLGVTSSPALFLPLQSLDMNRNLPIPLGGNAFSGDSFWAGLSDDGSFAGGDWVKPGGGLARMEWEIGFFGFPSFDGVSDGQSSDQQITGAPLDFNHRIAGLAPDSPYIWRARISTNNPLAPYTPWLTVQAAREQDLKFRTGGKSSQYSGALTVAPPRTVP